MTETWKKLTEEQPPAPGRYRVRFYDGSERVIEWPGFWKEQSSALPRITHWTDIEAPGHG